MSTLLARWRARRWQQEIEARARALDAEPARRTALQLERLNAAWEFAAAAPYWRELRKEHALPERFASLEAFRAAVPATTRSVFQEGLGRMAVPGRAADFLRMTGGSTAQPIQIPAWNSEVLQLRPDTWLGRQRYGIGPASRLFLIWGHAHLLGTGWRGRARALRVRLQDAALGYYRFSAYDLREDKLRAAAVALLAHRPEYVIGYSVALDRFARANEDRRTALRAAGVRVIVGTAESFPAPDSAARLADLFGCPVAMEYGSVETGLIAHTVPSGGYAVFWHSYLVDVEPAGDARKIFVTSLYPRLVPLVRYDMGDEVEVDGGEPLIGVATFLRVRGRCNDYAVLANGAIVHSELFTHAVRACAGVNAYQVVQTQDDVSIHYLGARPLEPAEIEAIRDRLGRIHPSLGRIAVERVHELERTRAGKTPMVVRR